LTNLERVVEAIEYAQDEGVEWWTVFDSPSEAKKVVSLLKKIDKDEINEHYIATLCDLLDVDIYGKGQLPALRSCIKKLLKQLDDL